MNHIDQLFSIYWFFIIKVASMGNQIIKAIYFKQCLIIY